MTKLEFLESLLEEVESSNSIEEIEELLQAKIEEAQTEEELAVSNLSEETEEDEEEDSY